MSDETIKPVLEDPIARNAERARRDAAVVMHYGDADGTLTETAAVDLLADLMHLAHREGGDFQKQLQRAEMHFIAETNGEP